MYFIPRYIIVLFVFAEIHTKTNVTVYNCWWNCCYLEDFRS